MKLENNVTPQPENVSTAQPVQTDRSSIFTEAQRHTIATQILAKYERLIYDAIHEALRNSSARDCSTDAEDIYQEVAMLIFARAHLLTKAGTAKLSTRLYSLAKKHVFFAHTSYWNRRHRINRQIVERGTWYPVERLSDEEIAAMRPKDGAGSDLGYGEAKLSLD
jgi:DNA-directed RNA polymerase specialized sigma24 family protein